MKTRSLLLCALSIVALACGGPAAEPVELRFEDARLVVEVMPPTPRVGTNAFTLTLRSADGEAIEADAFDVAVRMPAMGAMAAMGGPAAVTPDGPGRARAEFDLAMGGTWQIEIEARTGEGMPLRAEGTLRVGTPGLRLEAIASGKPEAAAPVQDAAEIRISPDRLQRIGIETTTVQRRALARRVRAFGRVVAAESAVVDVTLKVGGFATALEADALGESVERGEPLFEFYSPALFTAQQEYVQALRSQTKAHGSSAPDRADPLVEAARARLRLWDTDPSEIERLTRTGIARERVTLRAPISGVVLEKSLVEGSAFEAGQRLYRIVPLDPIWIEADVYAAELADITIGDRATATLPALPGRVVDARVAFLQPRLDAATRTLRVRLEIANPGHALLPEMNAEIEFEGARRERLVVPESAVLAAGRTSYVFRALGDGRFRPQAIEVGSRIGDEVEVVGGLAEGDAIVRAGTFLVAAESRLRAALETWE
ncbi:MAG: efflux RND transporter periplasmic adaptor subunit [Myxococcota bacterium]